LPKVPAKLFSVNTVVEHSTYVSFISAKAMFVGTGSTAAWLLRTFQLRHIVLVI